MSRRICSLHPRYVQGTPLFDSLQVSQFANATLTPGMVDLQVNGMSGIDFSSDVLDSSLFFEASRMLALCGVTRFLPTKITSKPSSYRPEFFHLFLKQWNSCNNAQALGWHLEGPFLNPRYAGVHCAEWMGMSFDSLLWKEILDTGVIRLVTVAPEVSQGMALLELCADRGVATAIGHTSPSSSDLERAQKLGCRMVTHLFNAMDPFHHRRSGLVGEVLGKKAWNYSLICDFGHVDEKTIQLACNAHIDGLILISDQTPIVGCSQPFCTFAGNLIQKDKNLTRTDKGITAGSALSLHEHIYCFCKATHVSFDKGIECVTRKPLALIRENVQTCDRDVILWQQEKIVSVWIDGKLIM